MLKRLLLLAALAAPSALASPPASFDDAKATLRQGVFYDLTRGEPGTIYCGCRWEWTGRSGGRVDAASCGYTPRAQASRGARIEWEHIVPAYAFGHQRLCWQKGGRENCKKADPVFNVMEADLHNLMPSVGELNADRDNFRYGIVPGRANAYGRCDFKVDFKSRVAEPRDAVKGHVARVYFYMHDRYDLSMSSQQEQLFMAWNKQFPVASWELEIDRRIARITGRSNPFVTGQRAWARGHHNSGEGLLATTVADHRGTGLLTTRAAGEAPHPGAIVSELSPIVGNQKSRVYHLPRGCPGYASVARANRVEFRSETQAMAAGFRKAKNCRDVAR